jgi:hypothetical protein
MGSDGLEGVRDVRFQHIVHVVGRDGRPVCGRERDDYAKLALLNMPTVIAGLADAAQRSRCCRNTPHLQQKESRTHKGYITNLSPRGASGMPTSIATSPTLTKGTPIATTLSATPGVCCGTPRKGVYRLKTQEGHNATDSTMEASMEYILLDSDAACAGSVFMIRTRICRGTSNGFCSLLSRWTRPFAPCQI